MLLFLPGGQIGYLFKEVSILASTYSHLSLVWYTFVLVLLLEVPQHLKVQIADTSYRFEDFIDSESLMMSEGLSSVPALSGGLDTHYFLLI